MRDYGKVHTSFWSSSTVADMSQGARMLALYLLTSPHSNITGVFRLPDGYAMEDLKWTAERVSEGFAELFEKGFANRCETTKWVWIVKHLEWNKPENPNQRKAAKKIALGVPDGCGWKLDFMRVWGESLEIDVADFGSPCETVSKPLLNQEQEQEQKRTTSSGKPDRAGPGPSQDASRGVARELLAYLNTKAGRTYREVDANLDLLVARLKDASPEQVRAVIDAKCAEWGDDDRMAEYLRPATLFNRTKFEQYLGDIPDPGAPGHSAAVGKPWETSI